MNGVSDSVSEEYEPGKYYTFLEPRVCLLRCVLKEEAHPALRFTCTSEKEDHDYGYFKVIRYPYKLAKRMKYIIDAGGAHGLLKEVDPLIGMMYEMNPRLGRFATLARKQAYCDRIGRCMKPRSIIFQWNR